MDAVSCDPLMGQGWDSKRVRKRREEAPEGTVDRRHAGREVLLPPRPAACSSRPHAHPAGCPSLPPRGHPGRRGLDSQRCPERGLRTVGLTHSGTPSPPRAVASLTVSAKAQPCWGVPSSLRVGMSHAGLLCAHTRGATWKVLEGACVCHRRSPGAPSPSRASPWRPALQQHPSARLLGLEPSRGQRGVCPLSGT